MMASMARGSARTRPEESLSLFDGGGATGGDARFAMNGAAIFERGNQMNVRKRRGKNAPRMARTLLLTRMASVKSPVTWVSAARKRLPKLWR